MAHAQGNPSSEPTYLEYFGFTHPAFARISKPSEIFHTDQHSLLMSQLSAAADQADCMVVICGVDGSGKTTLLNHFITSLGSDVSYASIDESCSSDEQFYCAFLRQLGFSEITGTSNELRGITKEFLVQRGLAGDPVLMIIRQPRIRMDAAVELSAGSIEYSARQLDTRRQARSDNMENQ